MKAKIIGFLQTAPVQTLCRIILGGLFIYASIDKIAHPADFAKIIHNYQLFPDISVYFFALVLPWVELVTGLFLVSGIYTRTAAIILSIMLTIFMVAISINLIRGIEFDCGCFGVSGSSDGNGAVSIVFRDLLMLLPGLIIIFFAGQKKVQRARSR